eukprot:comp22088_c0_seq1/m.32209 comp22088_c0_seq1/g.32209  ORF comp22088_c0_seq1/g.32209 comp22088_c0_seq1/m.32209 type:complete len:370 (-) comp22088_c0_seq1:140-1249(-)
MREQRPLPLARLPPDTSAAAKRRLGATSETSEVPPPPMMRSRDFGLGKRLPSNMPNTPQRRHVTSLSFVEHNNTPRKIIMDTAEIHSAPNTPRVGVLRTIRSCESVRLSMEKTSLKSETSQESIGSLESGTVTPCSLPRPSDASASSAKGAGDCEKPRKESGFVRQLQKIKEGLKNRVSPLPLLSPLYSHSADYAHSAPSSATATNRKTIFFDQSDGLYGTVPDSPDASPHTERFFARRDMSNPSSPRSGRSNISPTFARLNGVYGGKRLTAMFRHQPLRLQVVYGDVLLVVTCHELETIADLVRRVMQMLPPEGLHDEGIKVVSRVNGARLHWHYAIGSVCNRDDIVVMETTDWSDLLRRKMWGDMDI